MFLLVLFLADSKGWKGVFLFFWEWKGGLFSKGSVPKMERCPSMMPTIEANMFLDGAKCG